VAKYRYWKDAVTCVLGSLVALLTTITGARQLFVVENRGYGVLLLAGAAAVSLSLR
jgi:hypothetical protein